MPYIHIAAHWNNLHLTFRQKYSIIALKGECKLGKKAQRTLNLTLSDSLICEIEKHSNKENITKSEFVALAVKKYLREKSRIEIESLKKGYREMGNINLIIAENSLLSDESALNIYEDFLSESEK